MAERTGVGKAGKSHDWDRGSPPRCRNCGMLKTWSGAKHGCTAFKDTRAKRRYEEVEDAREKIVERSDR